MLIYVLTEVIRVLTALTRPFSDYVLDALCRLKYGHHKILPPIDNELLLLPAIRLAEKIRKKKVSCEAVMRAYLDRSKAVHPFINAVIDEQYEAALQNAKEVDCFLASTSKSEKEIEQDTPLLGVPFTAKEHLGIKGLSQTCGQLINRHRKAPVDGAAVAQYIEAGAIPYAVTNVPEHCIWYETSNLLFGTTFNPYNNTRTVGGSTGGEAALISSAAGLIGLGSDIAGSIRVPAAFCGIYGHKPTAGLVSNRDQYPDIPRHDVCLVTGPMCRYAADLSLLTKICSCANENVPWNQKVDFSRVKIYYMEGIPGLLSDTDFNIKKVLKNAVKYFEDTYKITAQKITIKEMKYNYSIFETVMMGLNDQSMKDDLEETYGPINLYLELFKCVFRCSEHTLFALYVALTEKRSRDKLYYACLIALETIKKRFQVMFEEDALLFIPTYCELPPQHYMTIPKSLNPEYTCIFNVLGYPATHVPVGLCKGLPLGFQVVSGKYKDHITLAAAVELEKAFGGWVSPCPVLV